MFSIKSVNEKTDLCDKKMEEILCSIHNYTKFSGRDVSLYSLAQAALDCGADVLFTTDRNIYLQGHDQFYYRSGRRLLMICGEELFDPLNRDQQHCLSLGIEKEQFNLNISDPQSEIRILVDPVGLNFSFRHIELINAEELLRMGLSASQKKIRDNIGLFDDLLNREIRCTGLVGTCSSLHRQGFSYPELISTAYNHILSDEPLTGDLIHDKMTVYRALRAGRVFMAVDGLSDAKGFLFSAEGNNEDEIAYPGDTIYLKNSITLKVNIPEACVCRLIRNGKLLKEWRQCRQVPYTIYEPGYYRVECALHRRHDLYDWIFTNPIYAVKG